MSANTIPIYTRTSDLQLSGAIVGPSANTAVDGTGANTARIFTADATEGSYVQKVILKPLAPAAGSVAATVARIWYCSDTGTFTPGTTNTAANTTLVAEQALPLWAVSQTAASVQFEVPINLALPASTKLLISFGTSTGAAGTGYNPLTVAGKY